MALRYAFMSFSTPELTLAEMLAAAKRLGYDGIEPRVAEGHRHGIETGASPADRASAKAAAREAGVALCCVATSCVFADPATAAANVAEARRCIALAADVGAPAIRVFGGKLGAGLDRAGAIRLVAEGLGAAAPDAAARGVTVCLETHDDWCDPPHVAEVMRRVNSPAVAVNWDHWHPVRVAGVSVEESFRVLKPWIRHAHFHDGIGDPHRTELKPVGQGQLDMGGVVRLLHDSRYAGYLSGEWIGWEPWAVHLPRELAAMKVLESAATR